MYSAIAYENTKSGTALYLELYVGAGGIVLVGHLPFVLYEQCLLFSAKGSGR
jgi:hypothetical protein